MVQRSVGVDDRVFQQAVRVDVWKQSWHWVLAKLNWARRPRLGAAFWD